MKHHKSLEFVDFIKLTNRQVPYTNMKSLCWRLSGDGSAARPSRVSMRLLITSMARSCCA